MLAKLIRKAYALKISYNRIHRYRMYLGFARAEASKRKQRKWVRYERAHSMSAVYIDWHEDAIKRKKMTLDPIGYYLKNNEIWSIKIIL
jgi:hypothetical protein